MAAGRQRQARPGDQIVDAIPCLKDVTGRPQVDLIRRIHEVVQGEIIIGVGAVHIKNHILPGTVCVHLFTYQQGTIGQNEVDASASTATVYRGEARGRHPVHHHFPDGRAIGFRDENTSINGPGGERIVARIHQEPGPTRPNPVRAGTKRQRGGGQDGSAAVTDAARGRIQHQLRRLGIIQRNRRGHVDGIRARIRGRDLQLTDRVRAHTNPGQLRVTQGQDIVRAVRGRAPQIDPCIRVNGPQLNRVGRRGADDRGSRPDGHVVIGHRDLSVIRQNADRVIERETLILIAAGQDDGVRPGSAAVGPNILADR